MPEACHYVFLVGNRDRTAGGLPHFREATSTTAYIKSFTDFRHLNMSSSLFLMDAAAGPLACRIPRLEFFELGGLGRLI